VLVGLLLIGGCARHHVIDKSKIVGTWKESENKLSKKTVTFSPDGGFSFNISITPGQDSLALFKLVGTYRWEGDRLMIDSQGNSDFDISVPGEKPVAGSGVVTKPYTFDYKLTDVTDKELTYITSKGQAETLTRVSN